MCAITRTCLVGSSGLLLPRANSTRKKNRLLHSNAQGKRTLMYRYDWHVCAYAWFGCLLVRYHRCVWIDED